MTNRMMEGKRGLLSAYFLCIILTASVYVPTLGQQRVGSLKEAFEGKFLIGTALNEAQITGRDEQAMAIVQKHFNSLVAENCMKSGMLQPREGQFRFDLADKFVEYGVKNNMHIHGHTLVWHSQAPRWFFTDSLGNDVSRQVLIDRMKTHIQTVVTRYKGKVHSWDVVNEAIVDDGSWRDSKFYKIIGEEFVALAFKFAHEADPNALLYYNDYSMALPGRRAGVVAMVKKLKQQGVPIHGIGMQGHIGLKHPVIEEFEKSIVEFSSLGMKVSITELDLSVLPSPWENQGADVATNFEYDKKMNPYTEGLPDDISSLSHDRYLSFFRLFMKHQNAIERVTVWGVSDHHSWKNNWPVRGRTDYPLLFDRKNQPKPIVQTIIDLAVE